MLRRFQSTHPRRVRPIVAHDIVRCSWFQSTHPRRVRPAPCNYILCGRKFQSTHPRRVRLCSTKQSATTIRFNPRTHVGCDLPMPTLTSFSAPFQSTHPRRVRRRFATNDIGPLSFNPRTHVGCDRDNFHAALLRHVSIHAPT